MANGRARAKIAIIEIPVERGRRIGRLTLQNNGLSNLDDGRERPNRRFGRPHRFDHGDHRVRGIRPGLIACG